MTHRNIPSPEQSAYRRPPPPEPQRPAPPRPSRPAPMPERSVARNIPSPERRPLPPQPQRPSRPAPTKRGRRSWKLRLLAIVFFLIGFAIFIYPWISQAYYQIESNSAVKDFESGLQQVKQAEIERRIELAKAYNSTLDHSEIFDPYSQEEKIEGLAEYARMLEVQEKIGHVQIPRINQDLPIYAGVSEDVLQKGVGHMEGTSLPVGGTGTHSVLTAHRGLPTARLFTDLDKLQKGDLFYVHNIEGTLAYRVDQILTVEPTDFDPIYVVPGQDYCTLLTCTPYMINSHRLLLRGVRVPYQEAIAETPLSEPRVNQSYRNLFLAALGVIAILLLIFARGLGINRRQKRAAQRQAEQQRYRRAR